MDSYMSASTDKQYVYKVLARITPGELWRDFIASELHHAGVMCRPEYARHQPDPLHAYRATLAVALRAGKL